MKKFILYLLIGVSITSLTPNAKAEETIPNLEVTYSKVEKGQLFAAAQFLPEMEDSEFGFGGRDLNNDYNSIENCKDYKITKGKCPSPKDPIGPCPFNPAKFKDCACNTAKFIFSSTTCVYTANGAPFEANPDRLLTGAKCRNSLKEPLLSKLCGCNTFRYTNDASCGNSDRIIDDRSSCQANDEPVRYETCKCNREIYPYIFFGNFKSAEFQNEVKKNCGHPKNFKSCKNFDNENTYKCAVDPSYKYDNEICSAENSMYGAQGASQTFTNGYGEKITLYKECDCPSTYTSSCDGTTGSRFYTSSGASLNCVEKHPTCSWGFYDEMDYVGAYNCKDKKHGSIIENASTCVRKNKTTVYRCKCKYTRGDWDYHGEMCGTCARKVNHVYCIENGVNKSNSCIK